MDELKCRETDLESEGDSESIDENQLTLEDFWIKRDAGEIQK